MDKSVPNADTPISRKPTIWRLSLMLTVPTILVFVLIAIFIAIYSALGHGEGTDINALINRYIVYFLILNHTLSFCLLMVFLRKDGLQLSDIGFRLPENGAKGFVIEIGVAVLTTLVVIGLITTIMPLFEAVQAENPGLVKGDKILGNGFLLALLTSVFVASFVEESIFRGYGMTGLSRHWGLLGAILISSIFFGLLHISYGLVGVFRTMFQGLVFAFLFARSRSLLGPMTGHSLTNLIGTLRAFDVI